MKNTIFILFCVCLLSVVFVPRLYGFPSQVIVDANQNCSQSGCAAYSAGTHYYFEAGVYRITPLSGAASFSGSGAPGWWIWAMQMYIVNSGQCPGIMCGPQPSPGPWFQTAQEALNACNGESGEIVLLTICEPSDVYFFFLNSACADNSGVMTAQVERLLSFSPLFCLNP